MTSSVTIRIPKDLQTQLRAISREERVPMSDLIRESLRHYIATRRFRHLRARVLPFAEAQGLLTDEDVFRAIS